MDADTPTVDASGKLIIPGGLDPLCGAAIGDKVHTNLLDNPRIMQDAVRAGTTTVSEFSSYYLVISVWVALSAENVGLRYGRRKYFVYSQCVILDTYLNDLTLLIIAGDMFSITTYTHSTLMVVLHVPMSVHLLIHNHHQNCEISCCWDIQQWQNLLLDHIYRS